MVVILRVLQRVHGIDSYLERVPKVCLALAL